MSSRRHASRDRSLRRSTTMAIGRGLVLVAVAVVVGIVLVNSVPTPGPATPSASQPAAAGSSHPRGSGGAAPAGTTTTTAASSATTAAPAMPPSKVKVAVANGTNDAVPLGATHLADALHALGYQVLAPMDTTQPQSSSAVYFAPGYDQAAAALAHRLQLSPSVVAPLPSSVPVSNVSGADVVVIEGPNLAQRFKTATTLAQATPAGAGGGTTTTAHGS